MTGPGRPPSSPEMSVMPRGFHSPIYSSPPTASVHAALLPVFERAERALDAAFAYCLAIPAEASDVRLSAFSLYGWRSRPLSTPAAMTPSSRPVRP